MDSNQGSGKKLRLIYYLSHQCGMDNDELHALAQRLCRVESLKKLTAAGSNTLIDYLRFLSGERNIPQRATEKQKRFIHGLFRELGWDEGQKRAFLEKHYDVSSVNFLPDEKVHACITALKSMVKRGYGQKEKDTGKGSQSDESGKMTEL